MKGGRESQLAIKPRGYRDTGKRDLLALSQWPHNSLHRGGDDQQAAMIR